ncbi:hypothetical protein GPJ56_006134 [Histomonas meleagridis]|uniref:uncharacterized protein n=1 Tax=Histomonas meleagridis TaxID=135588 RepID=UPI00355977DE|nr:hypothetical protein GPJ56_006134 [Histomonas meleagridis]KAH0797051.1 hypothetical protein GO595_010944 [Histomonas meleagridis]
MSFLHEEEFVDAHSNLLIPVVQKLLKSPFPVSKVMLLLIYALCKQESISETECNQIWFVAIEIAKTDDFKKIYPAMNKFTGIEGFKTITAQPVKDIISNFNIENIDSLIPLLRLFAFLNEEAIVPLMHILLDILYTHFDIACKVIDYLQDSDLVLLDEELIATIYSILSKELAGERHNAALALISPLAEEIVSVFPESEDVMIENIRNSLKSDNFSAFIACKVLKDISLLFEEPHFDLIEDLIPLLTSEDEKLLIAANKVAISLSQTGLYSTPEVEKQFIELLPKYNEMNYDKFSKLIISVLTSDPEPGLSLVEPVYDLAMQLLTPEKTKAENAIALDLFAEISQIETEYVEDQVVDGISASANILKSEEAKYFPSAAYFLSAMAEQFHDQSRDAILELLPILTDIVKERKINMKEYVKVAQATSDIISAYDIRDVASELVGFSLSLLDEKEYEECASQIIVTLANSILPPNAIECFTILSTKIDTIDETDTVENLIQALSFILKKYRIQIQSAQVVADKILEGALAAVKPPSLITDTDTNIFGYFKTFIKKFKEKSTPLCESLMAIVPDVELEILPLLLEPIEAAIDQKLLTTETISNFLTIIISMLSEDDLELDTSLITCLISVKRNYPQSINAPNLLKFLSDLWENIDETEGDVELPMAICMLTLELYGDNETGEGVNDQLLLDLYALLPLPADVCDLQNVLQSVIKITQKEWAHETLLIPSCIFLAKVLLLKKNKIDEYQISADVLSKAKKTLQMIAAENQQVRDALVENYGGNKANTEALKSILQIRTK